MLGLSKACPTLPARRPNQPEMKAEEETLSPLPPCIGEIQMHHCFPAMWEQLERFYGPSPDMQGRDLALTFFHVPYSLDSGRVQHEVPRRQCIPLDNPR